MRKKWAKTSAKVALLTAGFVVIGSGAGYAGELTHGDFGAGSGNQLHVPASAPINASGNAGSVLGQARSLSESGAHVHNGDSGNMLTSGRFGVIDGNQGYAPLSAPINVSGNAGTLGGQAWAASESAATVVNGHHHHAGDDADAASPMSRVTRPVTDTAHKVAPQTAQQAPQSPLSSVPSLSSATSSLPSPLSSITDATKTVPGGGLPTTGALPKLPLKKKQHMAAEAGSDEGGMLSSGDFGVLSGNQAYTPVSVPVNACGNAVSALGQAMAACKGGASVHNSGGRQLSSGRFGVLGGNQLNAPISAPVNLCGNSVAAAGQALAKCKGHATVTNGHTHRVWSPEPSMPEAPAPAPQQGPAEPAPAPAKPALPAPKPRLPKANLPKLPVGVQKPAPSCACAPAPMARTPEVPSVGLPKPEAPKVSVPKVEKPSVQLPKPQLPKASVPMPRAPKADVPLPVPQQVNDCGCAPVQHQKAAASPAGTHVTAGDADALRATAASVRDTASSLRDSMIPEAPKAGHLAKKHNSVGTPADDASRSVNSVLQGQDPTGLTGSVVK